MANRDTAKKNRAKQKRQDTWVIVIISIVALAIIGLIVFANLPKAAAPVDTTAKPGATVETSAKPMENGLSMGDPNAPVKVVEFADFVCPYCQLYWKNTEPTIISDYIATNKVYYTYTPMAFLGQESVIAAEAALCANDQGKFWEYRDVVLSHYTGENVGDYTQDSLTQFAKSLNLDIDTFTSCLTSGEKQQDITDANTYASGQGVNYTPAFMVNGKVYSSSEVQQAIVDALAGN
jgi:protein-disulfide isomerase